MKRGTGLLSIVTLAACAHWDLPRPPGETNLDERPVGDPKHPPSTALVPAEDGGESSFTVSPGFISALGGRFTDAAAFQALLGLELTLRYGRSHRSHSHPSDLEYFSDQSLGLSVAWTPLVARGSALVQVELDYLGHPLAGGLGWHIAPGTRLHGPQATVFLGPLYVRAQHLLGDSTSLHVGLQIKFPLTWTWAR